jgi:8-oxo-dGTP pyrophosphatase MutT (NUDIX family)
LIARYDRDKRLQWSLPKGHLEAEETIEEAAVREVEEETGIRGRIVAPLGAIDYWFSVGRRRIHKTVHHHLLLAVGGVLSDADLEVAEVAWFPLDEVAGRLAHADERELVAKVPDLLASAT